MKRRAPASRAAGITAANLAKFAAVATGAAVAAVARGGLRPPDLIAERPVLTSEDRAWVRAWIGEEVQRLRALSYSELMDHKGQDVHCDGFTPSGIGVTRDSSVFWDGPRDGALRVMVDAFQHQPGRTAGSLRSIRLIH